jgi:glucose repression regulatory protein TUP1
MPFNLLLPFTVSTQINELNTIRHSVYELETKHHAVCKQYEEEIRILRAELSNARAQQPPQPSPASGPTQPVPGYPEPYYSRGRDGPERERDRGPERDRGRGERDRAEREIDRERDQRDAKRVKTERMKDRPGTSYSTIPPPFLDLPPL